VGISLVSGVALFLFALVRITIHLVNLKKVKEMIFLYLRLFIFIFLYLTMFVFIFAYNIEVTNNASSINSGYEAYYQCLIYGEPNCSLDDSISNYNLVMLKGWAISSLGVLLFLIFMSIDVLKFWFYLFKETFVILFVKRKPNDMIFVFNMVAYKSASRSITGSNSLTLTEIGPDAEIGKSEDKSEEEDEEGEREAQQEGEPESSSSSE